MKTTIDPSSNNPNIRRRPIQRRGLAATPALAVLISIALAGSIQANDQLVRSFGFPELSTGANPESTPIQGSDGALYGTTWAGGAYNGGVIFRMNLDGSGYSLLHSFGGPGQDGMNPQGALVQGSDGALYGTTVRGGSNSIGTVFKLNVDGSHYAVLYRFSTNSAEGLQPNSLMQGSNGALYGTTIFGSTNRDSWEYGPGTIFKLDTDGTGYTVLHYFTGERGSGEEWSEGLVQGNDGALYGVTSTGGTNHGGTVFRINPDGSGYSELHSFSFADDQGANPSGRLSAGNDGTLYGVTTVGGLTDANNGHGFGTVFKLNPDGSGFQVLYQFNGFVGGTYTLVVANDGQLYGTSSGGGVTNQSNWYGSGTVFKLNQDGSGFEVIQSFIGAGGSGSQPAGLIQGKDNVLYGTTTGGGNYDESRASSGYGTIFKLNTDGSGQAVLLRFSISGGDGESPSALIQGTDGALFGMTALGGSNGCGTVFKVNPDGNGYSILHHFSGSGRDGSAPYWGMLLQGTDGELYGLTSNGGSSNYGTIFALKTDGSGYRALHSFGGGDGSLPVSLIQGSDGTLYGTTWNSSSNYDGQGTVFRVKPDGSDFAVIYNFASVQLGIWLTQGHDGVLYGTTQEGGAFGVGSVFKVNTNGGDFAVLYSFENGGPLTPLVQGRDEDLYGTTWSDGTIFKIDTTGTEFSELLTFGGNPSDGADFKSPLAWGSDGALYGTAQNGGSNGGGIVFRLDPDGNNYEVVHNFLETDGDGWAPSTPLISGEDGAFYGATVGGGSLKLGTVFRIFPRNLRARNATIERGHTGTVSVQLSAQGNEHALAFSVGFDTNLLTFVSATAGGDASGASLHVNTTRPADGKVGFILELPEGQVFPAGIQSLLQITFAASPGDAVVTTPVNFVDQPNSPKIVDAGTDFDLSARYVNASVTLTAPPPGAHGALANVLTGLNGLRGNLTRARTTENRKLDLAIRFLGRSLDFRYWVDETHLQSDGNHALDAVAGATRELQAIQRATRDAAMSDSLQTFIDQIVTSGRLLAETSIQDAANTGNSQRHSRSAQAMVLTGYRMAANGHSMAAIRLYENAWLQMRSASPAASFVQ